MVTKTAAIGAFLRQFTVPDLAELYSPEMEVQVVVAPGKGERIDGEYKGVRWQGYTDGGQTWKAFRIPLKADTVPEYNDTPMKFDLSAHAEGIGMTGWNWVKRESRHVAFDFDVITGHSDKHTKTVNREELDRVREVASTIPWVTTRYSTSGKGLHLYVMLEPVPTANHTEHAALARAILAQMSALTGYDFQAKVDVCGGNMWVWHRKQRDTKGLQLIKQGTKLNSPPNNWQQHVKVVQTRSTKFAAEEPVQVLASQRSKMPLDEDHLRLIRWLEEEKRFFWWDADAHMLVTHTGHLKAAHSELHLRGIFETSSTQSDLQTQNCFAFPVRQGGWAVRRYGIGTVEHPSWDQDGRGWTRTYFNREPTLHATARSFNGLESPTGGYVFQAGSDGIQAAAAIGAEVNLPVGMQERSMTIKPHKDGQRVVVEIPKEQHETKQLDGWLANKNRWTRIYSANLVPPNSDNNTESFDDVIRHMVTTTGDDAGWSVNVEGRWNSEPLSHVKLGLKHLDVRTQELDSVVGAAILRPWTLVTQPFKPEYPGNRTWNRHAPQFRFTPSKEDELSYPTWTKILEHTGNQLTAAMQSHPWCKMHGVLTGADYLKCWIASMLQFPTEPLPYLFIYGMTQATGKSILHEAIQLLFSPGYVRADFALGNSNFNGELEGAILCVVEETDLANNKGAYNKLKDWVTSADLAIHQKMMTPRQVTNTTHWIQCANPRSACPVFPGDTRITMLHVPEQPRNPIPKTALFSALEKEAPHFLGELLRLEIPPPYDRLRIPVVETPDKVSAIEFNQCSLDTFIKECCFRVPGATVSLGDFFDRFIAWLDPQERHLWGTKQKVSQRMPPEFPKGRLTNDSSWHWGNITFDDSVVATKPLVCVDNKLVEA